MTSGKTVTAPGLGLWPDVIVDQHFLTRQRGGTRLDVVGKSAAIVIDARRATIAPASAGAVAAGTGLAFHVLRSGMTLDLARP